MGSLLSMSGLGLFYIITLLAEPIVILITLGFLIYLKEKTIIEPSSGNTAIGLAMIGAKRGLKIKIVIPRNCSQERVKMLQFWGAKIEFCTAKQWQGSQIIEAVKKLTQKNSSFIMPNQYENPVFIKIKKGSGTLYACSLPLICHRLSKPDVDPNWRSFGQSEYRISNIPEHSPSQNWIRDLQPYDSTFEFHRQKQ